MKRNYATATVLLAVAGLSAAGGYFLGMRSETETPTRAEQRAESKREAGQGAGERTEGVARSGSSALEEGHTDYIPAGQATSAPLESPLAGMTAANAQDLLHRLRSRTPSNETNDLLRSFFRRWGELDPEAAIEASRTFTGRERLRYLTMATAGWSNRDPDAAWDFAMLESSNGRVRALDLDPIIRALAHANTEGALARVLQLSGRDARRDGVNAIIRAAEDQGNFAQTFDILSSALPNEDMREDATTALFRRWSALDSDAPLAAIERIDDPEEREDALRGFYQGWAETDSLAAYQYLLDNYNDPTAADSARAIGRQLARSLTASELLGALEMASGNPDARQAIASTIISDIARADPATAIKIAEFEPDPRRRAQQTQTVLREWAATDLEGAADYFAQIEDETIKARSIAVFLDRGSLEESLSSNSASTPRYLDLVATLSGAKARADSLQRYAQVARSFERRGRPELAARMASDLQSSNLVDEATRNRLLERIYAQD